MHLFVLRGWAAACRVGKELEAGQQLLEEDLLLQQGESVPQQTPTGEARMRRRESSCWPARRGHLGVKHVRLGPRARVAVDAVNAKADLGARPEPRETRPQDASL